MLKLGEYFLTGTKKRDEPVCSKIQVTRLTSTLASFECQLECRLITEKATQVEPVEHFSDKDLRLRFVSTLVKFSGNNPTKH